MKTFSFVVVVLTAASASATRLPLQMDFDRCTLAAENHGSIIQGRVRLELLVRKSGEVYGAFAHSASGVDDRRFMHCLARAALLWELPAVPVDYQRPYVVTFVSAGAQIDYNDLNYAHGDSFTVAGRTASMMPDINDPPPVMAPDTKLAQQTLELNDHLSSAEQGTAELAVHEYGKAIASFRSALEKDSTDLVALRGISHALAASGGDLKEARALAEKAVAIAPASESGHEALMHVCLAAHDDECAVAQFRAAKGAQDMAPRSRILAELQGDVRDAGQRLAAAAGVRTEDPCAKVEGEGEQALCVVKRCLDDGVTEYAKELSEQNHAALAAGDWTAQRVAKDRYVVHRPIVSATEKHDAVWLVTVGDQLTMKPASSEAKQITLRHNRCAARTLGSR